MRPEATRSQLLILEHRESNPKESRNTKVGHDLDTFQGRRDEYDGGDIPVAGTGSNDADQELKY